ncbi:hypothetical protein ACQEU6_24595 [Spirillospora sp. CA-108201]
MRYQPGAAVYMRTATVTALTAVRGLVVPAARFTAFLDAHPAT